MATRQFSASASIPAPAERVYGIIADYNEAHPSILPKPTFQSLVVEQGGVGAGTVIRVQMKVMGASQTFRAVVSEPVPGRVLVETNDTGYVTTFRVEPQGAGSSLVTISTEAPARKGVFGALESWLVGRTLRPVYVKELAQIAALASRGSR